MGGRRFSQVLWAGGGRRLCRVWWEVEEETRPWGVVAVSLLSSRSSCFLPRLPFCCGPFRL